METTVFTSDLSRTKGKVSRRAQLHLLFSAMMSSNFLFMLLFTYPYHLVVCVCVCAPNNELCVVHVFVQMLHQLTARALIRDWTEGSLDSNRMQHEVCMMIVWSHDMHVIWTLG